MEQLSSVPKRGKQVGYDYHNYIDRTKVHIVTGKNSLPIALTIDRSRECGEDRKLVPTMESIKIKQAKGRPRRRPRIVYLHQVQHVVEQVLLARKEHQVADARPAGKEKKR